MADASGKTGFRSSLAAVLILPPPPTPVECRHRCVAHGGNEHGRAIVMIAAKASVQFG
jgi:hypothetical protein